MERQNKYTIIFGISGTLLILFAVGAGVIYYLLVKSLPQTEGTADLPGLSTEVQVYRDDAGVPHILAASEYDAYVTAGYVHAQDRLWQMDMLRRYGAGRLAEVLGPRAVPVDRLMRTIGIHHIADSLLDSVSEQTLRILEAYSAGVNACIAEHDGKFPVEFDLLQYTPEPWTPRHSMIVARLLGWELALSWWVDLTLGELVQRLGEERARALFPTYPDDAPVIVPPGFAGRPLPGEMLREGFAAAQRIFGSPGSAIGSNSWVVTGSRSARGRALLANDPHLLHAQPARWYVMHMNAPGLNVAGVTVPGVPGVVIGHNSRIAWGMTNVMADDVDFFIDSVRYRDSTYVVAGRTLPLRVRTDSIFVRDSLPVVMQVYATGHGPVISDVYPLSGVIRQESRFTPGQSISMRWAGQDESDEILALYRINHAGSWDEFLGGLSGFGVPSQNFVYGDVDGNIGYTAAGHIPMRDGVSPQLPNNGSASPRPWRGYIPFAELPRSFNPPDEAFATANNRISASYPHFISNLWESEARVTRIREMLQQQPQFTAQDFKLMQMDVQSPNADTIRDAMVDALLRWPTRPVLLSRVMNRLADWDCRMHRSSVEASIYNAAYVRLLHNTFEDELDSTLFRHYIFLSNVPTRVLPRLLHDTSTAVFDDVRTRGVETRQHVLIKSVTEAVTELRARFGPDMDTWLWGDMHTVEFRHPLGEVEPLGRLLNVGPISVGGNNTTVNNGEFPFSEPYASTVGPSMRFIADLASPDSSHIILTTGQSGQPFSDHYADQTALWQSGATHTLVINPETVRRSSWHRLTLRPAAP